MIDPTAEKYDATPQQIALAWQVHRSEQALPIPGTTSIQHRRCTRRSKIKPPRCCGHSADRTIRGRLVHWRRRVAVADPIVFIEAHDCPHLGHRTSVVVRTPGSMAAQGRTGSTAVPALDLSRDCECRQRTSRMCGACSGATPQRCRGRRRPNCRSRLCCSHGSRVRTRDRR